MRILLAPSSYPPVIGGVQSVTAGLARHLAAQRHEVKVLTNHYPRSLPRKETLEGIEVRRLLFLHPEWKDLKRGRLDLFGASFLYYPSSLFKLRALLDSFQPDVVNVHFPDAQVPFWLEILRTRKLKLVVSFHGDDIERYLSEGRNVQLRTREELNNLLRQSHSVTACSEFLRQRVLSVFPEVAGKSSVTPNGIQKEDLQILVPYKHSTPYVFACARFVKVKGLDWLIQAFAEIADQYPGISLILAGEGDEEKKLRTLCRQHSLEDRVIFRGKISRTEMLKLLAGCEFLAVPSRNESFGLMALEGMSMGKLVLATRVGGLPSLLFPENNLLVDPGPSGLAQGLRAGLSQLGETKDKGKKNLLRAEDYLWDNVLRYYLDSYK